MSSRWPTVRALALHTCSGKIHTRSHPIALVRPDVLRPPAAAWCRWKRWGCSAANVLNFGCGEQERERSCKIHLRYVPREESQVHAHGCGLSHGAGCEISNNTSYGRLSCNRFKFNSVGAHCQQLSRSCSTLLHRPAASEARTQAPPARAGELQLLSGPISRSLSRDLTFRPRAL